MFTLVDDEDYEELSKYKWRLFKTGYVARNTSKNGKSKSILIHRTIMGMNDPKILCDHIDGNRLNNCKSNLRPCTNQQNQMNSKGRKGSSKFKGVNWHKTGKMAIKD